LVTLAGNDWVLPAGTDPKLKLVGLIARVPGVTAVTERGTERLALEAFELTVRLPLKVPAVGGAQVMFTFMLAFGASVMGMPIPAMVKPLPDTVALLTVTLEPPELVMVAVFCVLLPTVRVPKDKEPPLVNDPGVGVVVVEPPELCAPPTPVTAMDAVSGVPCRPKVPGARAVLPVSAMLPLLVPAAFGAKVTLKLTLPFGASTSGRPRPLTEKSLVLDVA